MIPLRIRAAAVAVSACTAASAADLSCQVVGVSDGDTITALCQSREQVKVRLAEIDAPEKAQPFGAKSKQSLSDLCFGKQARIASQGRDRYGRTIGRIYCFTPGVKTEIDANAEQVRRGFAWVYDRYVTDPDLYPLQDTARAERRGLWADSAPTPPWEWRKARR
jgi:endonuclease YncB( thermonuclease family)